MYRHLVNDNETISNHHRHLVNDLNLSASSYRASVCQSEQKQDYSWHGCLNDKKNHWNRDVPNIYLSKMNNICDLMSSNCPKSSGGQAAPVQKFLGVSTWMSHMEKWWVGTHSNTPAIRDLLMTSDLRGHMTSDLHMKSDHHHHHHHHIRLTSVTPKHTRYFRHPR